MKFYNEDNIELNYICSYAKAEITEDYLLLYNPILGSCVQLNGAIEKSQKLLKCLSDGIGDEELLELLKCDFSVGMTEYEYMLSAGIIE